MLLLTSIKRYLRLWSSLENKLDVQFQISSMWGLLIVHKIVLLENEFFACGIDHCFSIPKTVVFVDKFSIVFILRFWLPYLEIQKYIKHQQKKRTCFASTHCILYILSISFCYFGSRMNEVILPLFLKKRKKVILITASNYRGSAVNEVEPKRKGTFGCHYTDRASKENQRIRRNPLESD